MIDQSERGALFAKYYLRIPDLTTGNKDWDRTVDIHHMLEDCKTKIIVELIDLEERNNNG